MHIIPVDPTDLADALANVADEPILPDDHDVPTEPSVAGPLTITRTKRTASGPVSYSVRVISSNPAITATRETTMHEHIAANYLTGEVQTQSPDFTGDTDPRWTDEAQQALADLGQFVDLGHMRPLLEIDADALAQRVLKANADRGKPVFPSRALQLVGEAFIALRRDSDYRIGDVSLDLNPEDGSLPMLWGHPEALQLVWLSLRPGHGLTEGDRYEAICVAYQPDPSITWLYRKDGTERADTNVPSGYLGIVKRYRFVDDAAADKDLVWRSVRTLATRRTQEHVDAPGARDRRAGSGVETLPEDDPF